MRWTARAALGALLLAGHPMPIAGLLLQDCTKHAPGMPFSASSLLQSIRGDQYAGICRADHLKPWRKVWYDPIFLILIENIGLDMEKERSEPSRSGVRVSI
jgi:hypothetical protein